MFVAMYVCMTLFQQLDHKYRPVHVSDVKMPAGLLALMGHNTITD